MDTGNDWNWPPSIEPPDQVIFETTSVILVPSASIGLASVVLSTFTVQPGTGCTLTYGIGWSAGNVTSSIVVCASSRSFGTWNTSVANPPWLAVGGLIVTCAPAGAAHAMSAPTTTSAPAQRRITECSSPAVGVVGEVVAAGSREVPGRPRLFRSSTAIDRPRLGCTSGRVAG